MAKHSLTQPLEVHNTQTTTKHFVVLDNGDLYPVPADADPDFVRKTRNRILASRANPKPKAKKRTRKTTTRWAKRNLPANVLWTVNGHTTGMEVAA